MNFEVGQKVHVTNPKSQRKEWNNFGGTIIQILTAKNSLTNKEQKVHIVRLENGLEGPVEVEYLTAL